MERLPRKAYTYEFKLEAVRLVESGQSIAEAARSLGVVEQTLSHWLKAHKAGKLTAQGRGSKLTAEQIELRQLRAELARVKMERDILGKAMAYFAKGRSEVRLHLQASSSLARSRAVRSARRQLQRLPSASRAASAHRVAPPHAGSGPAGAYPRHSCRVAWRLWLAADVARVAPSWRARGQGAGAAADAAARHPGAWQAEVSRGHHRQQPPSPDRAESAQPQLHRRAA